MVSTQTPLPPRAQQLIGWGFPAELPLHIRSLGGREGGVDWALVSFPKGSMAWTPTSIVGVSPENRGLGTGKGETGLAGAGGGGEATLWLSGPGLCVTSSPFCLTSSCCRCHLRGPCHLACQLRWSVWHCCRGCRRSGGSRARAAG